MINSRFLLLLLAFGSPVLAMDPISNCFYRPDPICQDIEDCTWLKSYYEAQLTRIEARTDVLSHPPTQLVTKKGFIFTRVDDVPELGQAWRDPDGTIWGDIAKDSEGQFKKMQFPEAKRYCESRNARLPTADEYDRLRVFMGGRALAPISGVRGKFPAGDYFPEALPHLRAPPDSHGYGYVTSSTEIPNYDARKGDFYYPGTEFVFIFVAGSGTYIREAIATSSTWQVRCLKK